MTTVKAPYPWNFCPECGNSLVLSDDGQGVRPHCASCGRFYYSNPVPAACCILARGNEMLFVKRAIEPCKGLWSLPGGFVELGEAPEHAALRELEEETGLIGHRLRLMGTVAQASRFGAVLVLAYTVDVWEGVLVAGTDASDAGFFSRDTRPELAFQAHRELIARYDALVLEGHPLLPL